MSDLDKPGQQDEQPENESYTPAPPAKRAIAWIGIVYMVILVGLTTYTYYAGGRPLTGIAPLLAIPGLIGLGIVALMKHRSTGSPRKGVAWAMAIICWLAAVWFLVPGISGLLANFS